jgi:uncharacterized protein (DUF1330 family)
MAKAYFIVEIETIDQDLMAAYREHTPAAVEAFGGRFLVRGGTSETLEGDWQPKRLVVLEFPSLDAAQAFYHSEQYKPLLEMRLKAGHSKVVLVEGAPG